MRWNGIIREVGQRPPGRLEKVRDAQRDVDVLLLDGKVVAELVPAQLAKAHDVWLDWRDAGGA